MEETEGKGTSRGCPKCDYLGFHWKDGKRQACECMLMRKMKNKFAKIGEVKIDHSLLEKVEKIDPHKDFFIECQGIQQNKINGMIAFQWARFGIDRSLEVRNVYELIEIFLGHFEYPKSIFELTTEVLVLLSGYCEFENKRQEDIILQTLENRRRLQRPTWIITIDNRIKEVGAYVSRNQWQHLSMDFRQPTGKLSL